VKAGMARDAVHGLLRQWEDYANAPDITKFIKFNLDYVQTNHGRAAYAHGGIRHAAMGMVLPPTNPGVVLAAEPQTGGEALIPLRGISRAAAGALMNVAGAGYGLRAMPGGTIKIELSVTSDADTAMAGAINEMMRTGKLVVRSQYVVAQ
jgi:hypothetical protein